MKKTDTNATQAFMTSFVAQIYDKDGDLTRDLYLKMRELEIPLNSLIYEYSILAAEIYKSKEDMTQLLFETAVLDYDVDMQTYVRLMSNSYFDTSS